MRDASIHIPAWRQSILRGARQGLIAWLAYGVAEFLLAYAIPRFWTPDWQIAEWQWRPLGLIFGVYAAAGLLSGAAGGALLAYIGRGRDTLSHRVLPNLTLAAAFAANLLLAWPLARSEQAALAAAVVLAGIFIPALISEAWQRRAAFLASPWAVTLFVLGGPWASREALHDRSALMKSGVSLLVMAAVVALAALFRRIAPEGAAASRRRAAAAAVMVLLWTAAGWMAGTTRAVGAGPSVASAAGNRPNIILITMDTVRADHLSLYGYPRDTAPNLREFAREATVYDRAIAAADYTLPSHASIFTGIYPAWHGAYPVHPDSVGGRALAPGAATLAKTLAAKGYWTGGIFANSGYLQASTGLSQGFKMWETGAPLYLADPERPFYLRDSARRLLGVALHTEEFDALTLRASDINRRAFATLETLRSRGPFFLFLNYMDAHYPYIPPPPFRDRFARILPNTRAAADYERMKNAVNQGKRHIQPAERDLLAAQYDGGIAYLDSEIGRLFARLRETGQYDESLIVVTSDHGENLGEHDIIGHTVTSVYQEGVHVPLLVKYPGQHASRRSDALVSHVDIMPTVLEIAGCPPPPGLQGAPLDRPRSDATAVFSEARAVGDHETMPRLRGVRRAIFSGSTKLITWSGGAPEWYDLTADPHEGVNRYRQEDPMAGSLMARMSAWTAGIPNRLSKPDKLDKSTIQRLKSLGYVQ